MADSAYDFAVTDAVIAYYEEGVEVGRLGRDAGLIEAARTKELISRFVPAEAIILDVGGGPGYYAKWLAEQGHRVMVIDPIQRHVEEARRLAGLPARFQVELGDARALSVADESCDVVLLLGPLYHLVERNDRLAALREAYRVCRRGGVVIASAISRLAPALDGVRQGWITDERFFETARMQVESGWRSDGAPTIFPGYFHDPADLIAESQQIGLTDEALFGIEGPGWLLGDFEKKWADPVMRERLLWLARLTERDPRALAVSAHLLLVAHRPRL